MSLLWITAGAEEGDQYQDWMDKAGHDGVPFEKYVQFHGKDDEGNYVTQPVHPDHVREASQWWKDNIGSFPSERSHVGPCTDKCHEAW